MDEQKDLTPEPGFLQDWNFIYLRDNNIIFDLTSGIEYAYAENTEEGIHAVIYVYRIGSALFRRTDPLYVDEIAREFWRQLKARVDMQE